uniref:Uncharacterized protein n=1 Tax=Prymnesium polylepis TaxID=72548 RepID=A0A6T7YVH9_9EUKA
MGGKAKGPKPLTAKEQEKKDAETRMKAIDNMWKACKNDKSGDAEKAIKNGFPLDYADEEWGHTAMHRAAAFGALGVLRVLFKAGAPINVQNKAKETPLDTAKVLNNEPAGKLLEAFVEGKTGDDIADGDEDNDSDTDESAAAATPRTDDAAEEAVGKELTNAMCAAAPGKEAESHKAVAATAEVLAATTTVDCD